MGLQRLFWQNKIIQLWSKSSIVWLAGVRRSGKTTLAQSIEGAEYFNCDLPSVQDKLKNPEIFLSRNQSDILIFDEIHQLPDASMLLKIAADLYKEKKILATGSSTLIAGKKFKDTLTGRKRNLHFLPILINELPLFEATLEKRFLHGGLPPMLMSQDHDLDFYGEWLDSFYARDVQEMFSVDKRQPFLKTLEYLLVENASLLEVTKLAQVAGISRPTAIKYLEILEITNAITVLRPFAKNSEQELVSQPKVYGFDTGFCCYVQGIRLPSSQDMGQLLENLVLETLQAFGLGKDLRYWRTKQQKEIDFVLPLTKEKVLTIECKWKENKFDVDNLKSFRSLYKFGQNWVITSDSITRTEKIKNFSIRFINIYDFPNEIEKMLG
jgi:uncharacterized protein